MPRPYEAASSLPPLRGQRATVLGLAREGLALARYLVRHGAVVRASDLRGAEELAPALAVLDRLGVRSVLGGHPPELLDADVIYASPGVPAEAPILTSARQQGIRVSNATELVLQRCQAPVIGITGSSGKTTTTTLIGLMLRQSGLRTVVGGNIGRPVLDEVDALTGHDRLVLELSSFQLELVASSPQVAVVLNLTPDHLDRHPSLAAYSEAKLRILAHQSLADFAVLNWDDPLVAAMATQTPASVRWFSLRRDPGGPAGFLADNRLWLRVTGNAERLCRREEIALLGQHNVANVLAAALAAQAVGADLAAVARVARSFRGVAHRLELVATIQGRRFVNDSIATSPARSLAALAVFEPPIVLLAGGRHKGLPLEDWAATVIRRVAHLVLFGEAAPLLEASIQQAMARLGPGEPSPSGSLQVHRAHTLSEAFTQAVVVAPPGAVVLLSPACTSFDQYRDYVERGEHFRQLVRDLRAGG